VRHILLAVITLIATVASAQEPSLTMEEWQPRSTLVVDEHPVPSARFPVIDVHSHHRSSTTPERLTEIVKEMDDLNLRLLVNLSGRYGDSLKQAVDTFVGTYPKRFAVFANLNFDGIGTPGWGDKAAKQLAEDVKNGAVGLKFFKNFGMTMKGPDGKRIRVDDPSLEPVWKTCARLKIPVLIHVAEPAEFFKPHDKYNERWLELKIHPNRARPPDKFPPFETLMAERDNMIGSHPDVNYIVAHFGWHANDLGRLGALMDKYPNFYTETGAILAELGRQPVSGRKFFIKYQDRVLFGKDSYRAAEFPYYWRVFETKDEYFDYYRNYHAHWQMYGLDLPDDVLKKLYYKNALRVIPGLPSEGFPR